MTAARERSQSEPGRPLAKRPKHAKPSKKLEYQALYLGVLALLARTPSGRSLSLAGEARKALRPQHRPFPDDMQPPILRAPARTHRNPLVCASLADVAQL